MDTLVYLPQLVENKSTTIARLRELLFGIATEKTAKVLQQVAPKDSLLWYTYSETIPL